MDISNLCRELKFKSEAVLYTPPDPFRIYERLAKIYMIAHAEPTKLISNKKVSPIALFPDDTWWWRSYGVNPDYKTPLMFVKWVLQEIPKEFWKFNVLITVNLKRLKDSARKSELSYIWIDMKNRKRKLKCVEISDNVLKELKNKLFYLPSYEQIAKEVKSWDDKYKYKGWGLIKDQKVKF